MLYRRGGGVTGPLDASRCAVCRMFKFANRKRKIAAGRAAGIGAGCDAGSGEPASAIAVATTRDARADIEHGACGRGRFCSCRGIGVAARIGESPVSSVSVPPIPPLQIAHSLQIVVHGLRVRGNASSASLLSSFSMFCRDQLHLRAALTMRAVRVFKTAPGTAAGVVALHTGRELDMLFRAKRQHLRADCGVSIEPNRTRAERLACTIARRARRVTPSLQRSGAAEDSSDVAGQQLNCSPRSRASRSTLRADAPEFVPASASVSQHATSPPSSVVPSVHALHQE